MSKRARVRVAFRGGDQDERAGWWIGFDYDVDVVERLKRRVPPTQRTWDGASRLWWVSSWYEHILLELFGESFNAHLQQAALL